MPYLVWINPNGVRSELNFAYLCNHLATCIRGRSALGFSLVRTLRCYGGTVQCLRFVGSQPRSAALTPCGTYKLMPCTFVALAMPWTEFSIQEIEQGRPESRKNKTIRVQTSSMYKLYSLSSRYQTTIPLFHSLA